MAQIEERHDVQIKIEGDASLSSPTDFRLEYKALPPKEKGFFARTIGSLLSSSKTTEVVEKEEKETPKTNEKKPKVTEKKEGKKSERLAKKTQKKPAKVRAKEDKKAKTEENFKVVQQEAITVYDARSTSIVAVEEAPNENQEKAEKV